MDNKNVEKFVKKKEQAYRLALNNESGKEVLADLRTFCHATKTSFSSDPLEMARNEGRREVINRIMAFLKVDYEQIYTYEEEFPE